MKYVTPIAIVMALAAAPGVAAAADCDASMATYDREVAEKSDMRQQLDLTTRRDLRDLRSAAAMLSRYGESEACEEVVKAIHEIADDPQKAASLRAKDSTAKTDMTGKNERAEMTYSERSSERVASAMPLAGSTSLVASDLIGADLHNMQGEDLGAVDDVVIGNNESYLIVSHGGFLGIGDKQIAVPFDAAKISQDHDVVFINATEESIEAAPSFERNDRNWLQDDAWRKVNAEYYGSKPADKK